jgi:hypothetical protein
MDPENRLPLYAHLESIVAAEIADGTLLRGADYQTNCSWSNAAQSVAPPFGKQFRISYAAD